MKQILALFLLCFTFLGFSQDAPLEDKFGLESSLSFRKSNLKTYEDYLTAFDEKFSSSRELEEKQAVAIRKLEDEKKRIESLPEKKRKKQEKEYLWLTSCMKSFISGEKSKHESATFINQCFYTHNVDPRHFRKEDELSKLVQELMNSDLNEDQVTKMKEYRQAKEYKATLETSAIARAKSDIELLEKKLAARVELDKLVEKNHDCSKELKLNSDEFPGELCSSFASKKLALSMKADDPECELEKASLVGVYCDKVKANKFTDLRRLVVTQLSQKLPVGISKEKKSYSIIGLRKEKDECLYLVRNNDRGMSEWVTEKFILDKLEEIQHLKRQ